MLQLCHIMQGFHKLTMPCMATERFDSVRECLGARLHAGISRRCPAEALTAPTTNLHPIAFGAGWLQHRLEELARPDRHATRARARTWIGIQLVKVVRAERRAPMLYARVTAGRIGCRSQGLGGCQ